MSGAGASQDTRVSGVKPRPEGRVRERGWRPTSSRNAERDRAEAARHSAPPGGVGVHQ